MERSFFSHSGTRQNFAKSAMTTEYLSHTSNPISTKYVAISGRARIIDDKQKLKELWFEGLRVWFPKGPDDSELALLAIEVEKADYWADPASIVTYAFAYVKARITGQSPSADEIAEAKSVHFRDREGK